MLVIHSPLADDGSDQRPVLVMVDAGVTRGPGQALHLVRHTRPARARLGPVGADGERAGGGT